MPEVTIGIPVYNAEKTLERALDSALSQVYDQSIEIIAVDDGSTDLSYAILLEYAFRFPALVRVFRQANSGVAVARNCIIRESRSSFITWLDADDLYLPYRLANYYTEIGKASRAYNGAAIVYGDYLRNGEPVRVSEFLDDPIPSLLTGKLNAYLWATMAPRELYSRTGAFREELHRCEDLDLFLRFAKAGVRFVHVAGPPQVSYTFQTQGRFGAQVEAAFNFLISEYAEEYKSIDGFSEFAARRLWEVSNFYETERKWDDMWRCRGKALATSFEIVFPKLMGAISKEINSKIAAVETRLKSGL